MSGGHFNYSHFRMRDDLQEIASEDEVKARFPQLALALDNLGDALEEVIHEIDLDFCGDAVIKSDHDFEKEALVQLALAIQAFPTE